MTAQFVKEIIVDDPDGGTIELSLFKHENGGMFALDSSYIVQVLPEEGDCWIPDPLSDEHNIETKCMVNLLGI
jgi:hypothetical protein